MCEVEEIQHLWSVRAGDFIWVKEEDYVDCYNEKEGCIYVVFESEGDLYFDSGISCGRSTDYNEEGYFVDLREVPTAIWLPRQDESQDMIVKVVDYETAAILESKFHKFLVWLDEWDFISMEQLWLAFVMKEKYNKVWDGKEWIKEK